MTRFLRFYLLSSLPSHDCVHMFYVIVTGYNLFYASVEYVKVLQAVIPLMHAEGNNLYLGFIQVQRTLKKMYAKVSFVWRVHLPWPVI